MKYFVNIVAEFMQKTFLNIDEEQLNVIINAYNEGDNSFTISGETTTWNNPKSIMIYENPKEISSERLLTHASRFKGVKKDRFYGAVYSNEYFKQIGLKNVSKDLIGNKKFGANKEEKIYKIVEEKNFVHPDRIEMLKKLNISNVDFDLSKLIKLCEEINSNYDLRNFYSVGMLSRSLLDHIAPIFGFTTFNEVVNNFGFEKSVKKNLNHLQTSLRDISDGMLHSNIKKQEILPNENTIKFSPDLDVLLGQIISKLH